MSSQEFNSLKTNNVTFYEYNSLSIDATQEYPGNGVFVVPSVDVVGRSNDITGFMITAAGPEGKFEWKSPDNYLRLSQLADVYIPNPVSGQSLVYDGTVWISTDIDFNNILGVSVTSPIANDVLVYNGTNWVNLQITTGGITNLNGSAIAIQSFAVGTSGSDFNIITSSGVHTFNLPNAGSTARGALTSSDWITFNSKQSTTLASTNIWVGNALNMATSRTLSGDATLSNTGILTLANTGVTSGSYTMANITVDSKGRITAASSGAVVGIITSINGNSTPAQIITTGTSGTNFNVSSSSGTTTINLPTASSTVRGALSTSDWTTFNNKLSTDLTSSYLFVGNVSNVATGVPMSGDATLSRTGVLTLANSGVTPATYGTATNVPQIAIDSKGRVTSASNVAISAIELTLTSTGSNVSIPSASAFPGGTLTINIPTASASVRGALSSTDWTTFNSKLSTTLTDGYIWVGNASNVATGVSMSGDATISNSGVLTLANTAVSPGNYVLSNITVDSKGRLTSASSGVVTPLTSNGIVFESSGTLTTNSGLLYNPGTSIMTVNNTIQNLSGSNITLKTQNSSQANNVSVTAGSSSGNGNTGGSVYVTSGQATGTSSNAGGVFITANNGTGNGGNVELQGGTSSNGGTQTGASFKVEGGTSSSGGNVTVTCGNASGTLTGGSFSLTTGKPNNTGSCGSISLVANGFTVPNGLTGNGGDINITSGIGNTGGGGSRCGNITLTAATGNSSTTGKLYIVQEGVTGTWASQSGLSGGMLLNVASTGSSSYVMGYRSLGTGTSNGMVFNNSGFIDSTNIVKVNPGDNTLSVDYAVTNVSGHVLTLKTIDDTVAKDLNILTGTSSTLNTDAGSAYVITGVGNGSANGGDFAVLLGAGGASSGGGGTAVLYGGPTNDGYSLGARIVAEGAARGVATGGAVTIEAGSSYNNNAGSVAINAGSVSTTNKTCGSVTISAGEYGSADGTNGTGGSISIRSGRGNSGGSGVCGNVTITAASGNSATSGVIKLVQNGTTANWPTVSGTQTVNSYMAITSVQSSTQYTLGYVSKDYANATFSNATYNASGGILTVSALNSSSGITLSSNRLVLITNKLYYFNFVPFFTNFSATTAYIAGILSAQSTSTTCISGNNSNKWFAIPTGSTGTPLSFTSPTGGGNGFSCVYSTYGLTGNDLNIQVYITDISGSCQAQTQCTLTVYQI